MIEPFELNGKTIQDCFWRSDNSILVIEFTDGSKIELLYSTYNSAGHRIDPSLQIRKQ